MRIAAALALAGALVAGCGDDGYPASREGVKAWARDGGADEATAECVADEVMASADSADRLRAMLNEDPGRSSRLAEYTFDCIGDSIPDP